jgi:putative ABC transport system permease protein
LLPWIQADGLLELFHQRDLRPEGEVEPIAHAAAREHVVQLALSIFERTRELGVMRAVGMTRHQLRAMIRWESVIIALQGTVLGLLVGVFFGWALVLAMKGQGITVFSLPVLSLVTVVVLAAVAGLVAAILPSRRAAKLNILHAIVSE